VIKLDPNDPINALIERLGKKYSVAPPEETREPLEEFVLSFLMWESSTNRAEYALKRLLDSVVDINELRVTRPADIATLLGKTYPLAEERAERMTRALDDLFRQEHAVSLERIVAMNKRDGRKYLEGLEGMTPYISARAALFALGAHAIPIDDRTLGKLIEAGVIEEDFTPEKASGKLERHIKASDGLQAHLLLQAWSEDGASAPTFGVAENGKNPSKSRRSSSKKKTTRSKTAAKK